MKIVTDNLPAPKAELEVQKKLKQEFKLIGQAKFNPGLQLFSFNTETYELKKAMFLEQKTAYFMDIKNNVRKKKVNVEKDCIYFQALNMKNAIKKIVKQGLKEELINVRV